MYLHQPTILIIIALVATAAPVSAQEVRGGLDMSVEGGYISNPFLDGVATFWDPTFESAFASLGGTGWAGWSGRQSSVQLAAGGRFMDFPNGQASWSSIQVSLSATHALNRSLSVGIDGAGRILRTDVDQESVFGLPFAEWRITPRTRINVRGGLAHQQSTLTAENTTRSTSFVGAAGVEQWIGLRTVLGFRMHGSHTEVTDEENGFSGIGGGVDLTYRLSGGGSIRAALGVEQYGYEGLGEAGGPVVAPVEVSQQDYLWRASLSAERPINRRIAIFARTSASRFQSTTTDIAEHDVRVGAGLRVSFQRTLYEPAEPAPIWSQEGDLVRFHVAYEGEGELYLVGDFNNWDLPGMPMRRAGDRTFSAELRLEPGTYRYRIRVQVGGEEEWLSLPDHTLTITDEFDGENGLLIVE